MSNKARFLLRAIHALYGVLQAMLSAIGRRPTRNYAHRDLTLAQANTILADLAAITTRIHPTRVGPAAFAPLRPQPKADPNNPPPARPAQRPHHPARPLSARRLALRLDTLLQALDRATAALAHRLPTRLAHLAARIRTLAGCPAPEPATPHHPEKPTRTWATLIAEDWNPFTPSPTPDPARL